MPRPIGTAPLIRGVANISDMTWIAEEVSQRYMGMLFYIRTEDWDALQQLSIEARGFAHSAFSQTLAQLSINREYQATLNHLRQASADRLRSLPESLPEAGEIPDISELELEKDIEPFDINTLFGFDNMQNNLISLLLKSLQSLIHAEYNRAWRTTENRVYGLSGSAAIESAQTDINAYSAKLSGHQKQIFSALLTGPYTEDLPEACWNLMRFIDTELVGFALNQCHQRRVMIELLNNGKNSDAESLGAHLAEAGDLVRASLASYISAALLTLEQARGYPSPKVRQLIDRSEGLVFNEPLPDGADVELHKITDTEEGKFVQLNAIIEGIDIERETDGKLLSIITLKDPSSQASARVLAVYANLPNRGVAKGAFCKVHGRWKPNGQTPHLLADKIAQAQRGGSSFLDAFYELSDRWFKRYINDLNFQVAISPHLVEGKPDEEQSPGAAEIFYTNLRSAGR